MTSAIIVNLITNRKENLFKDYDLEEVISLSKTLNICCKHTENIKLNRFSSSTLINKGNLLRYKDIIDLNNIDLFIVNHSLTPSQQKNLENRLKTKVIDRTALIIEIFEILIIFKWNFIL